MKKSVGIVGGGFAGLYTAIYLRRLYTEKELSITIFDERESFLFTPLLHEVFVGSLPLSLISIPFSLLSKKYHFTFIHEKVTEVDSATHTINRSHSYDFIVLATGSKTPLPLSPHPHIYDVKSSEKIYTHIEKNIPKSVVVVGAGATGVETVYELSYLLYKKLGYSPSNVSLHLIASTNSILPSFSPYIQKRATSLLEKKFIYLHTETKALSVEQDGIQTSKGYFPADIIVWAVGITPSTPTPFNGEKRIRTSPYLTLPQDKSFFVIGDISCIPRDELSCVPPLAQSAVQEAFYVAKSIDASLKKREAPSPFKYTQRATLLSLGPGKAVGEIFGLRIYGMFAWWIWRTVYLFRIPLFLKKCSIAWHWTKYITNPKRIREK